MDLDRRTDMLRGVIEHLPAISPPLVCCLNVMSPDELLWSCVKSGGLDTQQWQAVVNHLFADLREFLNMDLRLDDDALIEGKLDGFCASFRSTTPALPPLNLQVSGTFGASIYDDCYVAVQGWLYVYSQGHRLATIADGHNHVFLRYARSDASNSDWKMADCSGKSGWRSYGWEADTYGEFDGYERWSDLLKEQERPQDTDHH